VQPPSIYKYFDSLLHIYDALFRLGQLEHLQVMRDAAANAQPGLPALAASLEASGQWCLANRSVAQLMFWRPVPSFEPSPEAFAPSIEMVNLQKGAIADAIAAGQLGPAEVDQVVHLVSVFIVGVLSQAIANEPDLEWGRGRFTPLFPQLMALLPALYPPPPRQKGPHRP
jgi:AcrR family transcriptional regulator